MNRPLSLALALAAVLALPSAAAAQSAKPVPCDPLPAEIDADNDARVGFANRYTPVAAEANQEIKAFFWRQEARGASRVLKANLVIKDLNQEVAPGSLGQAYRLFYTTDDGVDRFIEYSYSVVFGESITKGHFDQTGLVSDGDGAGRVWPGPDGVISLEIAAGAAAVTKPLTDVRWGASTDRGAVIAQSDQVPSTGSLEWDGLGSCDPPLPPPAG